MNADKKIVVVALVIGFLAGFVVKALVGSEPRYVFKDAGIAGAVFKVDTRTGQTWLLSGAREFEVRPQEHSQ